MKKYIIFPVMMVLLGLQVSCTSDAEGREQREEAEDKIERAEKSGEEIEDDRDVFGDDEIEIE